MKCCPACLRPFAPEIDVGGPVRQRIYDYIAKHPEGVTRDQLMSHVYAGCRDGGPENPNVISVQIRNINLVLKKARKGVLIGARGGPGSVYKLGARVLTLADKKAAALDTRFLRKVATIYGVSHETIRRWRRKYA